MLGTYRSLLFHIGSANRASFHLGCLCIREVNIAYRYCTFVLTVSSLTHQSLLSFTKRAILVFYKVCSCSTSTQSCVLENLNTVSDHGVCCTTMPKTIDVLALVIQFPPGWTTIQAIMLLLLVHSLTVAQEHDLCQLRSSPPQVTIIIHKTCTVICLIIGNHTRSNTSKSKKACKKMVE